MKMHTRKKSMIDSPPMEMAMMLVVVGVVEGLDRK
jgi:hypothetical protein